MTDLTLHFDDVAEKNIQELKKYYGVSSNAEVIKKALALLRIAAAIEETDGQLIAKKAGIGESVIHVR